MDEFGDDKRWRANHKARFLSKSWYLFFLWYDSIYAGIDIELPNFEWVMSHDSCGQRFLGMIMIISGLDSWFVLKLWALNSNGVKRSRAVWITLVIIFLPFLRFWVLSFEKWFSIFGTVKNSWLNRNRFRVTVTNGYDMLRDILTRRECFW